MRTQRRFRGQQRKQDRVAIGVIAIVLVGVLAFIFAGYRFHWSWTGFLNKALWDWLQLLIIPVVLAIGGFWLNQVQKGREQRATEQQATLERELTRDNQQETFLQAYLDKISELLLEKDLRKSTKGDEVREVARIRTLTVLRRLDAERQGSVLQFLYEAGLIDKCQCIINLNGAELVKVNLSTRAHFPLLGDTSSGAKLSGAKLSGVNLSLSWLQNTNLREADLSEAKLYGAYMPEADLREADLRGAFLSNAKLIGTNLSGANLSGANLSGVDLSRADLSEADLSEANLSEANLKEAKVTPEQLHKAKTLQGTIMPDGSKHP